AVAQHVGGCALCQQALERFTEEAPERDAGSVSLRLLQRTAAATAAGAPDAFLARLRESPPASAADALGSGAAAAGSHGTGATPAANGLPVIPGYEILGVLSRGGMGVVYKARHLRLNRLVALKMILSGVHTGPRGLARFLAEAEAVARLRHPNIVQIYDIGEAAGSPYFALEYVEGGSLARRLKGDPQ